MNANTAFQVTDTIGNAGTITVDIDTTVEELAAWYTQGEGAPTEVADNLEATLAGLFFTERDSAAEDFLGLQVEAA